MIVDPITLTPDATVAEALKLMRDNKIGGIPIVDKNNLLVGILTNRDMRFEKNTKKKVSEIMTKENLVTAPAGTSMLKAEGILEHYKIEKLPIVDKKGKLIGLITFRDTMQIKSHPNAGKDNMGRLLAGAAVGITADTLQRVEALKAAGVDVITLDSAHGHSKGVVDMVKLVKKTFQRTCL